MCWTQSPAEFAYQERLSAGSRVGDHLESERKANPDLLPALRDRLRASLHPPAQPPGHSCSRLPPEQPPCHPRKPWDSLPGGSRIPQSTPQSIPALPGTSPRASPHPPARLPGQPRSSRKGSAAVPQRGPPAPGAASPPAPAAPLAPPAAALRPTPGDASAEVFRGGLRTWEPRDEPRHRVPSEPGAAAGAAPRSPKPIPVSPAGDAPLKRGCGVAPVPGMRQRAVPRPRGAQRGGAAPGGGGAWPGSPAALSG